MFRVCDMVTDRKLFYSDYDHENIAMYCDKNFIGDTLDMWKGFVSIIKRCIYGKDGYKYAMEYTKKFWEAYKDDKKYFRIHINEGHEGTLNLIKYLDIIRLTKF